jgi:hypothetical protein
VSSYSPETRRVEGEYALKGGGYRAAYRNSHGMIYVSYDYFCMFPCMLPLLVFLYAPLYPPFECVFSQDPKARENVSSCIEGIHEEQRVSRNEDR